MNHEDHSPPLLTVRAALILGLAAIIGGTAGGLAYWAINSVAESILTAGAATASSIELLNRIISHTTDEDGG